MNTFCSILALVCCTLGWPALATAQGAGLRWNHDQAQHGGFSLTARLAPLDQPLSIHPLWLEPKAPSSPRLNLQALNLNMKWDWRLSTEWDLTTSLGLNYSLNENKLGLSSLRPASAGGYFGLRYRF
jgi:hypothetical protein